MPYGSTNVLYASLIGICRTVDKNVHVTPATRTGYIIADGDILLGSLLRVVFRVSDENVDVKGIEASLSGTRRYS